MSVATTIATASTVPEQRGAHRHRGATGAGLEREADAGDDRSREARVARPRAARVTADRTAAAPHDRRGAARGGTRSRARSRSSMTTSTANPSAEHRPVERDSRRRDTPRAPARAERAVKARPRPRPRATDPSTIGADDADQPVGDRDRRAGAERAQTRRVRRRRRGAVARSPAPAMTSVTSAAITPNAPSAIDSGLIASSTWATTGAVAWNSYCAPAAGSRRRPRARPRRRRARPWSSWRPYVVGETAAGARRDRLAEQRGRQHDEAVRGVDVVLDDLVVEHDDADQLHVHAQPGGCRVAREQRRAASPSPT